jgi:hypothetical protein
MIQVALLTEVEKDELIGVQYAPDCYYNPIQDLLDDWVISLEEVQDTINPDTMWVKNLNVIEYKPKPVIVLEPKIPVNEN